MIPSKQIIDELRYSEMITSKYGNTNAYGQPKDRDKKREQIAQQVAEWEKQNTITVIESEGLTVGKIKHNYDHLRAALKKSNQKNSPSYKKSAAHAGLSTQTPLADVMKDDQVKWSKGDWNKTR